MSNLKIFGYVALGASVVATAAVSIYKFATSNSESEEKNETNSLKEIRLGDFVVWGRPDSGKTTFIRRLQGRDILSEKEATIAKEQIRNTHLSFLSEAKYIVDEITDMPGTEDRLSDWLSGVIEKKHAFYVVNLRKLREDADYAGWVKKHLKDTVKALEDSNKKDKKIHIIATHVDMSKWSDVRQSDVNNVIRQDDVVRKIIESKGSVQGYFYAVNLTDRDYFVKIMRGIVNDII